MLSYFSGYEVELKLSMCLIKWKTVKLEGERDL